MAVYETMDYLEENQVLKEQIRLLNARIAELEAKSQESEKLKSAFLANMSHEVRTPLNAILGFSELLSDMEVEESSRKGYLDIIKENGQSLLSLIDDIIDTAKIEAQQLEISKSEVKVDDVLSDLLMMFSDNTIRDQEKQIDFKLTKPVGFHEITFDTDQYRFKQILSNLISNAIKYTNNGFVEFGFKPPTDHEILFYVKDSGIGISKNDQELIFEHFGQVSTTIFKSRRGTGLGLTICKNLSDLLGGKIWVESEVGKGSIFYLSLPYVPSKDQRGEKQEFLPQMFDWSNKTILIVEDAESNYRYLKFTLEITGVKILRSHNGKQAVETCLSNDQIDLVLMDIHLPVMNGYDATQMIKEKRPNLPIIAQTAFAMPTEREKSLKAGCDEYLSKPISRNDLVKMINKFLI